MITRVASLYGRLLVAAVFLISVTACGGGGGGGSFYDGDDGPETYFLALTLLDPDGNSTTEVNSAAATTLQAKVTRNGKNGAAIIDVVVSAETTLGILSPASGTALTNSSGIATFTIEPGESSGAGTITASVTGPSGAVTAEISFQVGNSGLRLGYLDENGLFMENEIGIEPNSILASQALAQLSLVILDEDGNLANSAETVTFSSGCIASGQAILDPVSPVVSGDGKIITSYQPAGCSGNDQITASLAGSSTQAFGTLSIAAPEANGFTFISATPSTIILRGTGGGGGVETSETSTVIFKVVDSFDAPVGGIKVDFSLTTYVGGLSVSPTSAISANDGTVKVNVFSGDIPTPVRVIATVAADDGSGQQVSSVSDILTVSTGLPDQDSISLSVEGGFVVDNGMIEDGVTRTLTVGMADQFNNPVPDGTAAYFTTEYGTIEPTCTTENGSCSVTWSSLNPRFPLEQDVAATVKTIFSSDYNCPGYNASSGPCPFDLGYTRGGRSTVLVSAIGEESFTDTNGNGIMDQEEQDQFENLSEAWLDKNEDNIFNPTSAVCQGAGADTLQCISGSEEYILDFNDNQVFDLNNDPAVYNGLRCPLDGDGVWCLRTLVNVRDSAILILSDPTNWYFSLFSGANRVSSTSYDGGVYEIAISDIYNNRPPAGSTISLSATGDCEIVGTSSFTVANTSAYGAVTAQFQTGGQQEESTTEDNTVEVTLTPPDGEAVSATYGCTPAPIPVDPNDPGLSLGG